MYILHFLLSGSPSTVKTGMEQEALKMSGHKQRLLSRDILPQHAPPSLTEELKRLSLPVRQSCWKEKVLLFLLTKGSQETEGQAFQQKMKVYFILSFKHERSHSTTTGA